MRSGDPRGHSLADKLNRDVVAVARHARNATVDVGLDTFATQDFGDRRRNIFVFACDQAWREFNDGYLASEAPVDLCKLQADIAAAQDDQMRRQKIDVHHRAVCEVANLIESGNGRRQGSSTDIDENPRGLQVLISDPDRMRAGKSGVPFVERAPLEVFQRLLN